MLLFKIGIIWIVKMQGTSCSRDVFPSGVG